MVVGGDIGDDGVDYFGRVWEGSMGGNLLSGGIKRIRKECSSGRALRMSVVICLICVDRREAGCCSALKSERMS